MYELDGCNMLMIQSAFEAFYSENLNITKFHNSDGVTLNNTHPCAKQSLPKEITVKHIMLLVTQFCNCDSEVSDGSPEVRSKKRGNKNV